LIFRGIHGIFMLIIVKNKRLEFTIILSWILILVLKRIFYLNFFILKLKSKLEKLAKSCNTNPEQGYTLEDLVI